MLDTVGSAAAPAARRRQFRRGSFIAIPPSRIALFDHLIGACEQAIRYGEAERLRRLEIDHQLVLGRRLYRKVGRFVPPEDAIDVAGRTAVLVEIVEAVG